MASSSRRRTPTRAFTAGRLHSMRAMSVKLSAVRRRRGWTQAQLAEKVGISQVRQSQIELGRRGGAPAELWFALSQALSVPFRMELGRCWLVRDTPRNRAVIERYPHIFEATFSGSSAAWVRAFTDPAELPPAELGLVWCEPRRARLAPWRTTTG